MILKPYSRIAGIYDHLMRFIDFEEWAEYIHSIYKMFARESSTIIELGSGTCRVSRHLSKYFKNIIVTDLSKEMLDIYSDPALIKICADMTRSCFKKKYNFIFSTFDSINYLLTREDLQRYFENMELILTNEGVCTFDVSLVQNSRKNLRYLNRRGSHRGIKYTQKSTFDEKEKIHYNYFKIKTDSGKLVEEMHAQRIYDFHEYFDVIEKTNLYVAECFEAFSFKDANGDSERAQFVIKKRKK